uniref:Uncharacterized protein n=1 Tax=Corethron hystrix TaxID=216773 RepID=A0A7S1B338_9STRA|mmetsp:Transcript_10885/g.23902  ORF Transcript_10885/g.23902 Transcript_10885/m.23902 type:complete len:167 (+) Transcript_10885:84-584(+)|eukprot:CAMPEP_0113311874 /NCGR_PEP_ID=MMETSP0010_2-20120614/8925_1 /TAXON_ID=216773 ORGANISM="Corethron hystrix, Strain 308" /NCGR_SAMPLE_ID=MMETSP0010_2 /ASSEMBLY_ACC=CAM_ASM_000155 /LENGTH=166 /DNA_ID=CAMNT_0000167577 /DNA_START=84 /DNA_END=584 /DNA_ORIENTATION=+ /assembly_acc=CAM_ASM_000155
MTTERSVKLVSEDGEIFTTTVAAGKLSVLVANAIQEEDEEETEVPLMNVSAEILKMVIKFCEHYIKDPMNNIEKPIPSSNMKDMVQDWYAEFIDPKNLAQKVLFEVILAANYMEIAPLLELGTAAVASMMRGRTAEEIRETFNIEDDLTDEEKQEIIDQNVWTEEP